MKCCLGILILGVGFIARAQDEILSSRADNMPQETEPAPRERSTFFFGVLPIPVLTQSASIGYDYALDSSWALQAGYQQIAKEKNENSLMGELAKVMNKNYFLGVRYALPFHPTRGLYMAAGYKKGSNEVTLRPPLFSKYEAKSVEPYEGVYGAVGYQVPVNRKTDWQWVTDFSVAYAPGEVKSSDYSASVSATGDVETSVVSAVDYGFFPSIQIGASF